MFISWSSHLTETLEVFTIQKKDKANRVMCERIITRLHSFTDWLTVKTAGLRLGGRLPWQIQAQKRWRCRLPWKSARGRRVSWIRACNSANVWLALLAVDIEALIARQLDVAENEFYPAVSSRASRSPSRHGQKPFPMNQCSLRWNADVRVVKQVIRILQHMGIFSECFICESRLIQEMLHNQFHCLVWLLFPYKMQKSQKYNETAWSLLSSDVC